MDEKIRSIWTDEITAKTETSATTQNVETLINLQALENEQVKPDFQCENIVLWVT